MTVATMPTPPCYFLRVGVGVSGGRSLVPIGRQLSQDTQYTLVSHMRYNVIWCLRCGVIVC